MKFSVSFGILAFPRYKDTFYFLAQMNCIDESVESGEEGFTLGSTNPDLAPSQVCEGVNC